MTSRLWWHATLVFVVAATGCLTAGARGVLDATDGPPSPALAAAVVLSPIGASVHALARSTPVKLRIRAIDVSVSLSKLGVNPDGTVEVPTNPQQPGWFRFGATPGQRGSAVILGHVDSYQGPAVFFRLGTLHAGDRVAVRLADGAVARFVVFAVAEYPKAHFPARKVYGSHGYSALQLVTCGGKFDRSTGHYLSNIVVYTRLVGATIGR